MYTAQYLREQSEYAKTFNGVVEEIYRYMFDAANVGDTYVNWSRDFHTTEVTLAQVAAYFKKKDFTVEYTSNIDKINTALSSKRRTVPTVRTKLRISWG